MLQASFLLVTLGGLMKPWHRLLVEYLTNSDPYGQATVHSRSRIGRGFIDGCQPDFFGAYGDDPDFDCDKIDESRIDYGAKEFWLFAVDLNSGGGWTEKGLRRQCLVLG
ncbi:hypothetical protein RHMOL_Rhmol04G0114900 [Rhododendron molle]|uniref:Uncharacterized protein n=1 Tax=Rhododendron molle TaxID=49168 RepID=A0ACC0NZG0_RHOML|nr:hypothetical protein RHMOL_Rhmol04G0114900 [Rhododendron molle]